MAFIKDKLKKIILDLIKDEELKVSLKGYVQNVARDIAKEELEKQLNNFK